MKRILVIFATIFLVACIPSSERLSSKSTVIDEVPSAISTDSPLFYPGAQELDISSLKWDTLVLPNDLSGEPQSLLEHQAWRTRDLPQKVTDYYDEALFNANWAAEATFWNSDEGWVYNHFSHGDDELYIGVLGNVSSAMISQRPNIGLEPGDTLIIVAIGNPLDAYLARGRELLEAGEWKAAGGYADMVMRNRLQVGAGDNDRYYQKALDLYTETQQQMSPIDAASSWLNQYMTHKVFEPHEKEGLERMRSLGLVREYEGYYDAILIDSYRPTGEWNELSNDGTVAVVEFVGVATPAYTNRALGIPKVESFDYHLQVTLRRNEVGIWEVDDWRVLGDANLTPTPIVSEPIPPTHVPTLKLPFEQGAEWTISKGYNTSDHGGGDDPSCGLGKYAIDLIRKDKQQAGKPVLAALGGTVWGKQPGSGSIVIRHDNNYFTWYSHMTTNDSIQLPDKGTTVVQGQVIGLVGATGIAYREHIHFLLIKWNGSDEPPDLGSYLPSKCTHSDWQPVELSLETVDGIRDLTFEGTPDQYGGSTETLISTNSFIRSPTQGNPAHAGSHTSPTKTTIEVAVSTPDLSQDKFAVWIGDQPVTIRSLDKSGKYLYVLEIMPPPQPADGYYDLTVVIGSVSATQEEAVQYATLISVDGSPEDWTDVDCISISDAEGDLVPLLGVSNPQAAKWIDFKSVCVLAQDDYLYVLMEMFGDVRPHDPETGIVSYGIYLRDTPEHKGIPIMGFSFAVTQGIEWYTYDGEQAIPVNRARAKAAYSGNFVELGLPLEEIRTAFPQSVYLSYTSSRNIEYEENAFPQIRALREGDVWNSYIQVLR